MAETYISADEVLSTDVICKRGTGGNHPGIVEFRSVISNNKNRYDKLPSRDREDFSRGIWNTMKQGGTRFVRETSPGYFVVLDDEKCARKIWSALRDCRVGAGGSSSLRQQLPPQKPQEVSKAKPTKAEQPKAKKQKLHWMTVAAAASPVQTKDFDKSAISAIKSVLENEALAEALRKNWGTDYDKKRERFEEQVLTRYRAAARQKGMTAEEFSKQLLPVLLQEAGGVNCVITESSTKSLLRW